MKSKSLIPHGDRTIAKICGDKWPRILSVRMAAAYTGRISSESFRKVPEFSALIIERFGKETVDRKELDSLLDKYMAEKEPRN